MSGFLHVCAQPDTPPEVYELLAKMGVGGIRLASDLRVIFQGEKPDFEGVDAAAERVLDAELELYFNPTRLPDAAARGLPTYGGVVGHGCLRWKKDAKTTSDIEYDDSKDYCVDPPLDLDHEVIFNAAAACASRPWSSRAKYVGNLNEPDDPMTPPMPLVSSRWDGDWRPAAQFAHVMMAEPFARGWKSVLPSTPFMGPETATEGFTNSMLLCQRKNVLEGNKLLETDALVRMLHDRWEPQPAPTYDVISYHLYPNSGTFPSDALARIWGEGGYMPWLRTDDAWNGVTPQVIGEFNLGDGADPRTILDFLAATYYTGLYEFVTILEARYFFGDGTEASLARGNFEPNDLYRQVQAMLKRLGGRRRAVTRR